MNKSLRKAVVTAVVGLSLISFHASARNKSVAVVVDETTYSKTSEAVGKYTSSIRTHEGKKTFVIVLPDDVRPEVIRDTLKYLYNNRSLEGAVLVGDIPVPMIRRAHHLATAFKMNPDYDWHDSSIPSDRFYDDFGLSFKFLKNDGRLFFYDLSPEGRQKVECDIYSARIKPAKNDPGHSFTELISEFLTKAAEAKSHPEKLDNVFHFGGHGNSSESFNARIDEDRAMYEQFGFKRPDERVHYINFDEDKFVKARIQSILSDESVDYVHFHSHGAEDTQYLSKEPYSFMTSDHADNIRQVLRARMRSAKDKQKTAESLLKQWDVPESWLKGWDDPEVTARDSVRDVSVNIILDDLNDYKSGPKVIILDACFNGAFIHDDYVAARYAFNHNSRTMVVFGNSVNIIQDHWKNELAGLMTTGTSVGEWAKQTMTLESHMFGDPTYTFEQTKKTTSDTQCKKIKDGKYPLDKVKEILISDERMNVRLEALMYILRNASSERDVTFALEKGLEDPYEMVRRMAAKAASTSGDPALLQKIAEHYLDPLESARVRFQLRNAIEQYPADDLRKAFGNARRAHWPSDEDYDTLIDRLCKSRTDYEKELAGIADSSLPAKERRFTISAQRNKCNASAIDPMLTLLSDETADKDLRLKSAEALGWYVLSYKREDIYNRCKALSIKDEEVKDEVRRTIRRLEDNANL